MRTKRTRKEILDLQRLCAEAIHAGPNLRGPDPDRQISMKTARERARALVRHCLGKPVTADA